MSILQLVVVGAGLAGLTTARRALQFGIVPTVIERFPKGRHPCASRANGGVFHVAFHSVMQSPDTLRHAITGITNGFVEPKLAAALSENVGRGVIWLQSLGAEFTAMQPHDDWKDFTLAPLGFHESTTMAWQGGGADRLIDTLMDQVIDLGGIVLNETRMIELVREGDDVTGLVVEQAGRQFRIDASAIVLADGGFEGDEEMLSRYVTTCLPNLKLRGIPSGLGSGIRAARAIGAKLVGMESFYGHLLSADSLKHDNLSPFPFLEFLASEGILVDAATERFVDETTGGHFTSNQLAKHGDGLATVIFDDQMWQGIGKHFFCPPNPNLVDAGGTLHIAETLPDLARAAGLDEHKLMALVNERNHTIKSTINSEAGLSTPFARGRYPHKPLLTPPFYAAPACAAVTSTLGGVAIDASARVLDEAGRPIGGLFATGSVTGGLEGGPDVGYVGGLSKALVFGLLAAESIALDRAN